MEHNFKFGWPEEGYDKNRCISISAVLELIDEPFDSDTVAQRTFEKNFDNPESKYYQMTKEQILESWSEKAAISRQYGSQLDDYIGCRLTATPEDVELFKLDYVDGDERMEGHCSAFDKFYNEKVATGKLEFIDREQYLYYPIEVDGEQWWVRGRFDALFYNTETNHYVIIDWKSNGEIETVPTKWTKKLLGPAKCLYALSGVKYTTQVFFYKMSLEAQQNNETVDVAIINLPAFPKNTINAIGAQYKYDKTLMESILRYAIKKKQILDKKS